MKNSAIRLSIVALLCFATAGLHAQNVTDLIINEVLVENTTGPVDGYGNRSALIEVLNTSYGTVDFGGCYISDDKDNLKKYFIPKGDAATKLKPRQIAVFFACGEPDKGTFYTNFILEPGSSLYLVSNDGKTVIDSLDIPECMETDKSICRLPVDDKWKTFETILSSPTPFAQNYDVNAATKSQIMEERDPHGWIMTVTAVCVVFFALLILSIIYMSIGKIFTKGNGGKGTAVSANDTDAETALAIAMALDMENGDETHAAIATALHLYMNDIVHDEESFVITIRPAQSAWASKQFTLRQLPERRR